MNFLESYLLMRIERRNRIGHQHASEMENTTRTKKKEILDYMNVHSDLPEVKKLHEDFLNCGNFGKSSSGTQA
ncbi:MAG: hypothetical protein JRN10_08505 [Nitrososphaerota archaeon]|jgi:hypothetical protein|nr:hypothetical protein [Nitrososphaerota archaeon]MDG6931258.1 hypothetical protein [Nitrososphaerota archaeon]